MPRPAFRAKFEMSHVQRAAGTNSDLLSFLKEIGFPGMPPSKF